MYMVKLRESQDMCVIPEILCEVFPKVSIIFSSVDKCCSQDSRIGSSSPGVGESGMLNYIYITYIIWFGLIN